MMVTVQIVKDWDYTDWKKMSPGGLGEWEGVHFTETPKGAPDYVVVLNQPPGRMQVEVSPDRVWAIIQEPPIAFQRFLHRGQRAFTRIYTADPDLVASGAPYVEGFPATPWIVNRSFDELCASEPIPSKSKNLSWISSSLDIFPGHKARMAFMDKLRGWDGIDLFGRGINYIEDKWDGLAPYRYSIAYENFRGDHYWSEKLADCYLAGAMPIYIGCRNIEDYFPKGSFIQFDPNASDPIGRLKEIVESSQAEDSRESLIEARRRCLHEYQLLPFIAKQIAKDTAPPRPPKTVELIKKRSLNPLRRAKVIWHWQIKPRLKRK